MLNEGTNINNLNSLQPSYIAHRYQTCISGADPRYLERGGGVGLKPKHALCFAGFETL